MEFGLYAPLPHVAANSEELRDAVDQAKGALAPLQRDPAFELARDVVLAADAAGFDVALFAERLLGPDLEAWVLASALAGATDQIRIMPAIHPSLWSPTLAAKMLATLDRISPGRSAINLVTGWWQQENKMFGGGGLEETHDKYAEAIEFVEVLRALWQDQTLNYRGDVFTLEDADLRLKPAGGPPPVYAASRSPEGRDMVARVADYWFVPFSESLVFDENALHMREAMTEMDRLSSKYDRQVKYGVNAFVICDDTDAAAQKRARDIVAKNQAQSPKLHAIQTSALSVGLVGSPDTIRTRIQELEELGFDLLLIKFLATRDEFAAITNTIEPLVS